MFTLSALLFSFILPAGGELYVSDDSIYAEYKPVDFTLSIFDEALATQAITEFRTRAAQDDPAGPDFGVSDIVESVIAGYPSVTVDYSKPALRAELDSNGNVVAVKAREVTRQVYLDTGANHVVFTTWTKAADQDIPAISDGLIQSITAGSGREAVDVDFRLNGLDITAASEALSDDPAEEAVTVEVIAPE